MTTCDPLGIINTRTGVFNDLYVCNKIILDNGIKTIVQNEVDTLGPYYIDNVSGSNSNDGSYASPWLNMTPLIEISNSYGFVAQMEMVLKNSGTAYKIDDYSDEIAVLTNSASLFIIQGEAANNNTLFTTSTVNGAPALYVDSPQNSTNFYTVTITDSGMTVNQHKGKFLLNVANDTLSPIIANTTDTISYIGGSTDFSDLDTIQIVGGENFMTEMQFGFGASNEWVFKNSKPKNIMVRRMELVSNGGDTAFNLDGVPAKEYDSEYFTFITQQCVINDMRVLYTRLSGYAYTRTLNCICINGRDFTSVDIVNTYFFGNGFNSLARKFNRIKGVFFEFVNLSVTDICNLGKSVYTTFEDIIFDGCQGYRFIEMTGLADYPSTIVMNRVNVLATNTNGANQVIFQTVEDVQSTVFMRDVTCVNGSAFNNAIFLKNVNLTVVDSSFNNYNGNAIVLDSSTATIKSVTGTNNGTYGMILRYGTRAFIDSNTTITGVNDISLGSIGNVTYANFQTGQGQYTQDVAGVGSATVSQGVIASPI